MKKKLIFATGNEGKMKEIREILGDLDYEILSMKEAGVDVDIVEDGTTFEENAIIKDLTITENMTIVALNKCVTGIYLNHKKEKLLLGWNVGVDAHGSHAEIIGQGAHRKLSVAVLVNHAKCRIDHLPLRK